ncbi:GntR family transcriptional regulator [Longispora sp. K20-0274]|uniref:GntR family transcriptional regulator n=1 Tax=Longispora sp. K20-0274 TaxID=3088255 RepID=UPI00399A26B2
MIVTLVPDGPVPPFEQLRAQILDQVRTGTLPVGTRLPTVRALAEELGIAPNTVARAYRELEHDGVLETRGRNGTFVTAFGDAAQRRVQEAAAEYAATVRRLGVDPDEALRLAASALRG